MQIWAKAAVVLTVSVTWAAWGGCKKHGKPSSDSRTVRCSDLADDFAGALQESGQAAGPRSEKTISTVHDKLREACLQGHVPDKVFSCLAQVKPRVFSKMVSCLPDDLRSLLPDLEDRGSESGEGDEGDEGDGANGPDEGDGE